VQEQEEAHEREQMKLQEKKRFEKERDKRNQQERDRQVREKEQHNRDARTSAKGKERAEQKKIDQEARRAHREVLERRQQAKDEIMNGNAKRAAAVLEAQDRDNMLGVAQQMLDNTDAIGFLDNNENNDPSQFNFDSNSWRGTSESEEERLTNKAAETSRRRRLRQINQSQNAQHIDKDEPQGFWNIDPSLYQLDSEEDEEPILRRRSRPDRITTTINPTEVLDSESEDPSETEFGMTVQQAIDFQVKHLSTSFFCSPEEHEEYFQDHEIELEDANMSHMDCRGISRLREMLDPDHPSNPIPNVLSKPFLYRGDKMLGHSQHESQARNPNLAPRMRRLSVGTLRLAFEGTRDHEVAEPTRICMYTHLSRSIHPAPTLTLDWDSFMGWATSFAAFSKGITCIPYSNASSQMKGKLHGLFHKIQPEAPESEPMFVSIEKLPHKYLGFLAGWSDISVYIVFPTIFLRRGAGKRSYTTILTKKEETLFYECVLWPALKMCLPADQTNTMPETYDDLEAAAHVREETARFATTTTTFSLLMKFALQGEYCGPIWDEMQRQVQDPELALFKDMRIWYNGKNLKDSSRSKTCTELQTKWREIKSAQLDINYAPANLSWVDRGRQFSVKGSSVLWKPCCSRAYHRARLMLGGTKSDLPLVQYQFAGLEDVASYTITPRAGTAQNLFFPYFQIYSKSKDFALQNGIPAFFSPDIEVLAHSLQTVSIVEQAGRQKTVTPAVAGRQYVSGKKRTSGNATSLVAREVQAREETRERGDVFEAVTRMLAREETVIIETAASPLDPDDYDAQLPTVQTSVVLADVTNYESYLATLRQKRIEEIGEGYPLHYDPLWVVDFEHLGGFFRGALNRALCGFEAVLSDMRNDTVTHAQTATACLLLQSARFSTLSKQEAEAPELFRNEWTVPFRSHHQSVPNLDDGDNSVLEGPLERIHCEGMDMRNSMRKYGFAWWAPKMDWSRFLLKSEHAPNFFQHDADFIKRFKANQPHVQQEIEYYHLVNLVEEWLSNHGHNQRNLDIIFEFTWGFLMKSYRAEIWSTIVPSRFLNGHPNKRNIESGILPLTAANMRENLIGENKWYLATWPNKPSYFMNDWMTLLRFTFEPGKTFEFIGKKNKTITKERFNWDKRGFRQHFEAVYNTLESYLGPRALTQWKENFYQIVHATNPLLPVSDNRRLVNTGKENNKTPLGWQFSSWSWPDSKLPADSGPVTGRTILETMASVHHQSRVMLNKSNPRERTVRLQFEADFDGRSLQYITREMENRFWPRR
jgi:hypothetical protein